ncbi:MAG: hypothetical protein IJZ89_08410 [Clostridia bacterium]|nr:hypothetical protein [Clostridia bacterium]
MRQYGRSYSPIPVMPFARAPLGAIPFHVGKTLRKLAADDTLVMRASILMAVL